MPRSLAKRRMVRGVAITYSARVRILLTSDLHYRLRQYDWLIGAASAFDVVVVAGDHLDISAAVPGDVQIAALSASFAALAQKTRLLVCSGNHDLDARSSDGEKTASWLQRLRAFGVTIDGDTVRIADTLFTVCPWWDGPKSKDAVEQLLIAASAHRIEGERWVWLYHAPPEGKLSWTGKRHFGDPLVPQLLARHKPTAVFCGHIHEAPFRQGGSWIERVGDTWLFNAGHQIGDVPARIEIDFNAGIARWITMEGTEAQSLAL
jgi:Icc-related predicted phosphoesterase